MTPVPEDEALQGPKESASNTLSFRSDVDEPEPRNNESRPNPEGGHMSSTAGRVMRVPGAKLPYIVTLTHHLSDATKHFFATMREAEAFIKRNTPVPRALLSTLYDRPASESKTSPEDAETAVDAEIVARLERISERLRQYGPGDAASVLSAALVSAGINRKDRLRLLTATEKVLDERSANHTGQSPTKR